MLRYTLMSAMLLTMLLSLSAEAATKITAKAGYKNGKLNYSGSLKGAPVGTQVSVYDGETGLLLHAMQTNAKNAFSYALPIDNGVCNVKLVAGDAESVFKVNGAPGTCKTGLVCDLSANNLNAKVGESVSFNAKTLFKGKTLPNVTWDFGNGETKSATTSKAKGGAAAAETQSYTYAGRYNVTYSASLPSGEKCQDTIVVSVAPNTNLPQVSEAVAAPATGSGMNGDYSIIPFSDRSDIGVANDMPNVLVQNQNLNAIVYKKEPKKPAVLGMDTVDVFYSAASNPNDPYGPGSINSTSQNWFADGTAGANFDTAAADVYSKDNAKRKTVLLAGKSYAGPETDGIKKTGLYDRILNRNGNGGSDMSRLTSTTTSALQIQLDEGARGTKDLLATSQSMPGRSGAYSKNEEQKINAYDDLGFFSAQMLPIVGVDDKGRKNPFPLMRVSAKKDDINVATDAAVIASTELSCAQCHSKGGISANDNNWFTPVTKDDPEAKGDGSALGTNSGSSYPNGRDNHDSIWAPAIQNRFELKIVSTTNGINTYQMVSPLNSAAANLRTDKQNELFKPMFVKKADGSDYISTVTNQPMILRGDRVKDYRFTADGKLQIQLNFVAPENDSPQAKERAAFLNMAILHDYYDSYGPSNPAVGGSVAFATQFADTIEDKVSAASPVTNTNVNPTSCGGHHFSNSNHDTGRSSIYDARFVYSNYSRTMHAFHGRIQVYKETFTADGVTHLKGEVIRDKRGHHVPFGGAGWDPEKKNNYKTNVPGQYDGKRNDFDPIAFPMDPRGELLIPFDLKRDQNGEMVKQTLTANTNKTDMNENCSICHAGKTEKVYHDMHYSVGLTCESCHGDMQAVGGLWLKPGTNFTDHSHKNFRVFDWDQPDCGSCHFGSKAEAGRLAFAAWDKSATPLEMKANSIDQRFAVMPTTVEIKRTSTRTDKVCLGTSDCEHDTLFNNSANGELSDVNGLPLFRKSKDTHGNVPCAACHGPAHAIWPVKDKNANQNVTAKQLQGYEGTLMECDVCHSKDGNKNSFADGMLASTEAIAYGKRGTLVTPSADKAYLAGPHGLHPVGDENWFKNADGADSNVSKGKKIAGLNGGWHNDMAKKPGPNGEDQCAACHGGDHKGTRLSKTLVERTFTNDKGKQFKVKAGEIISCGLCHSLSKSFTGAPNPKAKDGGWPKPTTTVLPATPTPKPADVGDVDTAADPGVSSGGGGHSGHG